MGEKRGFTGKLDNNFNTAGVLEVKINHNWYRTTSRDFRSFDGPRRITEAEKQPGQGIERFFDVNMVTKEYFGPVYIHSTNDTVTPNNSQTIRRTK